MRIVRVIILTMLFMYLSINLHAESIFLKDGKIIEGKIRSESDSDYQVETENKKITSIKRSKVKRITGDDSFRIKRSIKHKDGRITEVYIVEENMEEYVVRNDLDSPYEYVIKKKKVISVSTEKYYSKTKYYLAGIIPGLAQIYVDSNAEGITFFSLFCVSSIVSGYAWYDVNKKHDAYNKLSKSSTSDEFDSKYDDYKKASYFFTGSIIFTGLVYIANWVDVIWFAAPDFGSNESVSANEIFYRIDLGANSDLYQDIALTGIPVDYSLVTVRAGIRF